MVMRLGENLRLPDLRNSDNLPVDFFHQLTGVLRDIEGILNNPINPSSVVGLTLFENTVIVQTPDDLLDIDSTKNYMLDGVIDMGSQSIEVPETGLSLSGLNGSRDTSQLISSEDNYTMFTSPAGSYSGNLVLESCTIDLTGTNSQVFDLNNDGNSGAIDITEVNFGQSPVTTTLSLGELTEYRQLLLNNVGFIFIDDGLTFNGAWTGFATTTTIAVGFPASTTLFKEGTGLTFDNVRSNINFLSVDPTSVLYDFDEANITSKGGFALSNVRSGADDAVPNLPSSSSYARVRNCVGIGNTYVGGQWTVGTPAATSIPVANTLYKIAGATTYTDLQWFTQSTDNAFVYDGDQTIEVEVKGNLSFTGTTNNVIDTYVRQWDDSAGVYINLSQTAGNTLNSSGRVEGISFNAIGVLDNNDRIELWVENTTGNKDVTAETNGYVILSERPS